MWVWVLVGVCMGLWSLCCFEGDWFLRSRGEMSASYKVGSSSMRRGSKSWYSSSSVRSTWMSVMRLFTLSSASQRDRSGISTCFWSFSINVRSRRDLRVLGLGLESSRRRGLFSWVLLLPSPGDLKLAIHDSNCFSTLYGLLYALILGLAISTRPRFNSSSFMLRFLKGDFDASFWGV